MGKYSDKEIELNNGETVTVELSKNFEEGGTSYSPVGTPYGFSSLEDVKTYLDKETDKTTSSNHTEEEDHEDASNEANGFEIDYSLSEDNNSLDDTEYDVNGNDTNGHYDDDGDYWAEGHNELDCS